MNSAKFRLSIDELYARLIELTQTKGEEYKRRDDNQFANFERGGLNLGLTREQVLMVYLSKHLDSITTYVKDRAVGQERQYAEPISGRIDDAILYLLLLRGMTIDNDQEFARRVVDSIEAHGVPDLGAGDWSMEFRVPKPEGMPEFAEDRFPARVPMRGLQVRCFPIRPGHVQQMWPVACRFPLYAPEPVSLGHALDPVTEAFRQMAEGGKATVEDAAAGLGALHDNARPSVEPEPARPYTTTVFISSMQSSAVEEAKKAGLPAATCALSTPDQLYGMQSGARVIFIHHGNKNDEYLLDEVRAKCHKQQLALEVRHP